MPTIPQVDNPSFLTLAAIASIVKFDKELADLEATDYYRETKTATILQHCVGTSLANEYGDIERPPPMKEWPTPCLDTGCICGHKRTWCSYYCHHSDVALVEVHTLKGPKWLSSGEHQLNITLNTQLHRRADAEGAKRFSLVKDN